MFKPVYSPKLSLTEIRYLSDAILTFLNNDENLKTLDALFEERYQKIYKGTIGDGRRQYVYDWYRDNNFKIGKFYTFDKSFINDETFDDILLKIFGNINLNLISIQALTGGNYLIPHIDLGNRNVVVKNYPIFNYEMSQSIFFKKKENVPNYAIFTFEEIKEIARFKYTPNYVHEFDASIPHSVFSRHEGFRIMLSCYS